MNSNTGLVCYILHVIWRLNAVPVVRTHKMNSPLDIVLRLEKEEKNSNKNMLLLTPNLKFFVRHSNCP